MSEPECVCGGGGGGGYGDRGGMSQMGESSTLIKLKGNIIIPP